MSEPDPPETVPCEYCGRSTPSRSHCVHCGEELNSVPFEECRFIFKPREFHPGDELKKPYIPPGEPGPEEGE